MNKWMNEFMFMYVFICICTYVCICVYPFHLRFTRMVDSTLFTGDRGGVSRPRDPFIHTLVHTSIHTMCLFTDDPISHADSGAATHRGVGHTVAAPPSIVVKWGGWFFVWSFVVVFLSCVVRWCSCYVFVCVCADLFLFFHTMSLFTGDLTPCGCSQVTWPFHSHPCSHLYSHHVPVHR